MTDYDVIVVGAGAAGLMAAFVAARGGLRVMLIEKMEQPGRKLRITGKGRCNLTNTAPLKDFVQHVGSDGRFLRNSLARFANTELMNFFEQQGVALTVERGGRVFPASGRSLDIFLSLITPLEHHPNVTIQKSTSVSHILTATDDDRQPHVVGVQLVDGHCVHSHKVILATGGSSYPSTGSTGDGYIMAQQLGHTVVPPVPSLVPLVCTEPIAPELVNFSLRNVALSVYPQGGNKPLCHFFGEMTFTDDGLAGPIVLSASRMVTRRLHDGQQLTATIDLKPALTPEVLDRRLLNDLNSNGTRLLHDAMRLWMPAELIPTALHRLKIAQYKRLNQITGDERKKILHLLKDFSFTLTGTRGFDEAIVTQGGVSLREVNPKTMESKLVTGLHLVGEVLDLDADTGGYNLQIAFTTAVAAASTLIPS